MPVTGLPIRGPEAVGDGDVVIVMNSNYRKEIAAQINAQKRFSMPDDARRHSEPGAARMKIEIDFDTKEITTSEGKHIALYFR